jgi:2-oxoglutarate dehydrogenase E1 component
MSESLRALLESSALGADQAAYLESLYEQFIVDPGSVEPRWRDYFSGVRQGAAGEVAHGPVREALAQRAKAGGVAVVASPEVGDELFAKQGAVSRLVQVYCNRGHLVADIDPLGLLQRPEPDVLKLGYFGLSDADLDSEFHTYAPFEPSSKSKRMKLRDIIARFKQIYCGNIGAEFAHVSNTAERLWLQDRFQDGRLNQRFTTDERKTFLWQLTAAEGMERYLATKYPAQKRFSLEGGDSLIPLMDDLIQQGGVRGVQEIVIGMAHRGRLNMLVNVLGKSPQQLFSEFEGLYDVNHMQGSGDVKYHKGFSTDIRTPGGNVHVALAFNPPTWKSSAVVEVRSAPARNAVMMQLATRWYRS